MDLLLDIASGLLLAAGAFFCLAGGIGMLRLPDVFTRMHAAGMVDTAGMGLILLGLMLQAGFTLVLIKLILIAVFITFTSPTTTHALCRASINGGHKPDLTPHKGDGQETGGGSSKT